MKVAIVEDEVILAMALTLMLEDWGHRAEVAAALHYRIAARLSRFNVLLGVPVVIFSNRMSDVDFVTYVGSDDETIGYEITKYLAGTMGNKGKIIHIDGVPAAITAQNRKKGLERALKELPNVELLASQPGNYRRLPAVQVFENLMQRFPVIDGVVCANDDMAVGVAEALAGAGRGGKTKVVGIDAIPDGIAAIQSGKMQATADYSGLDIVLFSAGGAAAIRHLRGEKLPKEIALPVVIVEKANAQPWAMPVEEKPLPDWNKVLQSQKKL